MIYDCFKYAGEDDLLRLRLRYLAPVIDVFVIAEATRTHSGAERKMTLPSALLSGVSVKLGKKIEHVLVEDLPVSQNRMVPDIYQRKALAKGLEYVERGDIVLISDIDEIPNREHIATGVLGGYMQEYLYFYMNTQFERTTMPSGFTVLPRGVSTAAVTGQDYLTKYGRDPQAIRDGRVSLPVVPDGGWHITWQGGAEGVAGKLTNFAHGEYDRPDVLRDLNELIERVRRGDPGTEQWALADERWLDLKNEFTDTERAMFTPEALAK